MTQGAPPVRTPRTSPTSSTSLGPLLARFVVVMVGLTGVFAAGYGAFATWVISNDWLACVNPAFQPISDYPSSYCETVPWPSQFGIGIGLLLGGFVAIAAAIWLLRSRYAARPTRR
jgi:hypothetical protein